MKKWNKYDTKFILRSLGISSIAILIWVYFYSGQINKNYLDISLSEKEAKQKAQLYLGSRGWDISGYTFSCKYADVQTWAMNPNLNYIHEKIVSNKNIDELNKISKLAGLQRWNMRWYNPPSSEEYQVSYTKNGDLAYFNHIIPDTSSGNSLPDDIAYNIAKIFLKNMTNLNWQENEWKLQQHDHDKKENRLDHYFQWENKNYNFSGNTIRMSIRVKGDEVTRFNQWFLEPDGTRDKYRLWVVLGEFVHDVGSFIKLSLVLIGGLIALFYFKISTNWKIAIKYSIFIFSLYLSRTFLEIPVNMYNYSSEDILVNKILMESMWTLFDGIMSAVYIVLIIAASEKLYRKIFPNHLSFENIINPSSFNSKLFFNNYFIGFVFSLCILAFSGIFYTVLDNSGYYIAFPRLDFNNMLTYNPLLYILSFAIEDSFWNIIIYTFSFLLSYHLTKSKRFSILIASVFFSFNVGFDTDPVYLNNIYLFIIGLSSGFILLRFGVLSLWVSSFSYIILSNIFLYFYTSQLYFITTGIILILLLLSPLIYNLLYYIKHQHVSDSKSLLNSAISSTEYNVAEPQVPELMPIQTNHTKWAWALFCIGILCLFVPNNDDFPNLFEYKISKSEAIEKAKNIIENDLNEDLTDYKIGVGNNDSGLAYSWSSYGPFHHYRRIMSPTITYINGKIGKSGIVDLVKKYNIPLIGWFVRFYIPNEDEQYYVALDGQNNNLQFINHFLSDSLTLPSVPEEEAKIIVDGYINQHFESYNIDLPNLSIIDREKIDHNVRVDQGITYKRDLILNNISVIDQKIGAGIRGNKMGWLWTYIDLDQDYSREYWSESFMHFITQYLPYIFIFAILFCLYHLIRNNLIERLIVPWKLIIIVLISVLFIYITYLINLIPVMQGWYQPGLTWSIFWIQTITDRVSHFPELCLYVIIPISCAYLMNPSLKNLFSNKYLKLYQKDAFISSIATIGALFLFRPIQYLLDTFFSQPIIDINFVKFNIEDIFALTLPGYGLFLSIIIETLLLFSFSIFLYHKYISFSKEGKNIQKYVMFISIALYYIFISSFLQSASMMIPYFLYRLAGLSILLILIKYFWKGNPLSHLFGILFYFQLENILKFISFADPSIKYQGWILIVMLGITFIFSFGTAVFQNRPSSNTA